MLSSLFSTTSSSTSIENYIPFKQRFTLEQRKAEFGKINKCYPDKFPIIVEKNYNSNTCIEDIDKHKFLVQGNMRINYMHHIIRKRIPKLTPDIGITISVNKDIFPPMTMLISQVYAEHKDEDGFLYIKYTGESTFG